jgi:protein-tyrosine kinase
MPSRKKKGWAAKTWDEFGNTGDGGLAVVSEDGVLMHRAPPPVTGAVRYFISRVLLEETTGPPPRLAVTSALRREGVTFVTKSLGAVLAYDHPFQVAVVDLNWWSSRRRKGKDKETDEVEPLAGISDVVDSGAAIDDVVIRTSNPRLSFVPAGEVQVSRRPGLARSDELAETLDELEKRFDILLLDVPAIRATSDSMNLVRLSEDFVLVVRQGVTTENQVKEALNDLGRASPLGVILNKYKTSIPRRLGNLLGV